MPQPWPADGRSRAVLNWFGKGVRLKSIAQSILHANLIPSCPFADLFGGKGRAWLRSQYLPDDEREAVERHVEEYNHLSEAVQGGGT